MPSQVAGVVVGDFEVEALELQLTEVFCEELGDADDPEISGIVVFQSGVATGTARDDRVGAHFPDLLQVVLHDLFSVRLETGAEKRRGTAVFIREKGYSEVLQDFKGLLRKFRIAVGVKTAHEVDVIRFFRELRAFAIRQPVQAVPAFPEGVACAGDSGEEFFLAFRCDAQPHEFGTRFFHNFRRVCPCRAFGGADPAGCTGCKAREDVFGRLPALKEALDDQHAAPGVSGFPAHGFKDRAYRTAGPALHTFVDRPAVDFKGLYF